VSPTPVRGTTWRGRHISGGEAASEGGVPEPTRGMVVVRGQEGMHP